MTRRGFALAIATTTAVAATLAMGELRASPLDAQGCNKLKDERVALEQAGVRGSMAKGPEWAKSNLSPDKLEQVRRLIDVDAQLTFRCHGKPLVLLPPEIEADPAAIPPPGTDGKAAVEKKGAVKKAAARPADKGGQDAGKQEPAVKRAAPAGKAAATKANAEKAAQPPGDAPAKAKPKPKANDAYRPSPGDPTGNPFAGQTK